jgi:hypothetical protein
MPISSFCSVRFRSSRSTSAFGMMPRCLALLLLTFLPVLAAPVTFNLSDVNFVGGISATGSFAFDSSTSTFTDVDVTVSGPNSGFFNFFASGPVAFNTIDTSFNAPFTLILLPPGGASSGNLNLLSMSSLSSVSPATVLLAAGTSGFASALEINGTPTNDIQTLVPGAGSALVPQSTTPEPGTIGLVALALSTIVVTRRLNPTQGC